MRVTAIATAGAAISIQNVCHSFGGKDRSVQTLTNVNLEIPSGSFLTLLGPSGCGKTTLLRILDGLIPPSSGQVVIAGTPVTGPGVDRAFVFQDAGLLPWRTGLGNVEFGMELQGVPRSQRRARALEAMHTVGLDGFAHYFPHQLSGGMRQRVGLARALVLKPLIMLMDEPFAALDAQTRELMQMELQSLWHHMGQTVVFVTHSIDEAVFLSTHVAVMTARPGQIKRVIPITLDRSGDLEEARNSTEFVNLRRLLWGELRSEISRTGVIPTNDPRHVEVRADPTDEGGLG